MNDLLYKQGCAEDTLIFVSETFEIYITQKRAVTPQSWLPYSGPISIFACFHCESRDLLWVELRCRRLFLTLLHEKDHIAGHGITSQR